MPAAPFGPERLMLLSLALVLSLGACQEPDAVTAPSLSQAVLPTDTTLTAARDGYVTSKHPNRNGGAKDSMDVAQPLRSLVAFDQAQIVAAVGTGTLSKATLRLTIGRVADNWGPTGRTIDVHRVTVPWTEAGETYNCAIDSDPTNATKDCAGATEWAMGSATTPPWAAPRTAQALVTTATAGTLEFDVTADVAAFLAGTPNEGWLLKKTDEDKQGRIVFLTKEGGAAPQLVLTVSRVPPDTARPQIPVFGFPHDTAYLSTMASDSSIYYRRLVSVSFYPTASGSTINDFLTKYSAVIVGGRPSVDAYVVQVPDPGPSLDSLTALRSRMSSEPGVQFVILLTAHSPPPVVDARFPIDGPGFNRVGWGAQAGGDPLWALKSIRAPLAWGCETGTYGSAPVTVGVVEWGFRALHDNDDLPMGEEPIRRFASRTIGEPTAPGAAEKLAWHGTAVTGMLTAEGNNEGGVAGVTWRSDLYLYSLGTPTPTHSEDEYVALVDEIIPRLKTDRPRVVNLSVDLSKSSENPQRAAELSMALQALLKTAPSMLIVKPSGNDAYVITPDALAALPGGSLLLLDALVRTRQAGFRDQVIIVGGTERLGDGVRVDPSLRFVDGEMDIVAPARAVRVLGGTPFATDVVDTSGTSFAAPMVAGVAAQLLAMQPNLSPAQVKQYILEGAQQPRLDPTTGLTIGPEQLRLTRAGATQSVFQLDAYGALTLLSRSDPSTPVCGLAVLTTLADDSVTHEAQTTVHIEGRSGFVYQGAPASVTVAQGGRRIGIDQADGSFDFNLQNGAWMEGSHGENRGFRQFLERDTAFVEFVNGTYGESIRIRGPSGQGSSVNVCGALGAAPGACRLGVVSSTGDWVHAVVEADNSDLGCGPSSSHFASYLVPARGAAGGPTELRNVHFEACRYFEPGLWRFPIADVVAWRADGAVAWVAQSDAQLTTNLQAPDSAGEPPTYYSTITSMTTKFRQESVVSGVPSATARTVSGPAVYALGWRVDGRNLLSYEYYLESFGVCVRTVRAAGAPEVEVAGPVQFPPSYCGDPQLEAMPASVIARSLARAFRPVGNPQVGPGVLSPKEVRARSIDPHARSQVLLPN